MQMDATYATITVMFGTVIKRPNVVNKRKLANLEKKVPGRAVAALNAANQRAVASKLPRVVVIEGSLYRVSASGAKELIRTLPPRTRAPGRAKRSKA